MLHERVITKLWNIDRVVRSKKRSSYAGKTSLNGGRIRSKILNIFSLQPLEIVLTVKTTTKKRMSNRNKERLHLKKDTKDRHKESVLQQFCCEKQFLNTSSSLKD